MSKKTRPPERAATKPSSFDEIFAEITGMHDFRWPKTDGGTLLIQYRSLSADEELRITALARRALPPLKPRPALVAGLPDEEQPKDEVWDVKDAAFIADSLKCQAEARALALFLCVPVLGDELRKLSAGKGEPTPEAMRERLEKPTEAGGMGLTDAFLESLYVAIQGGSNNGAPKEVGLAGFFSKPA
jgi:hypothetical protein